MTNLDNTSLTYSQLANPYKTVRNYRKESMSVLERSFWSRQFKEIKIWEDRGIVDDAMAGRAPGRRKYSETLLTHLLNGAGWSINESDLGKTCQGLWDRGASRHTDLYHLWLPRSVGLKFADTLVAAGASPHESGRVKGFYEFPVIKLLEEFHTKQGYQRVFKLEKPGVSNSFQDEEALVLEKRLDHWLSIPCDQSSVLDDYLIRVTALGISRDDGPSSPWRRWRDQLIDLGARANMGHTGAIKALVDSHPKSSGFDRYWGEKTLKRYHGATGITVPEEEQKAFLDARREATQQEWSASAMGWLNKFIPTLNNSGTSSAIWQGLLQVPGGIEMGRVLIESGVETEWAHAHPFGGRPSSVFSGHSTHRNHDMLKRFLALTDGFTISSQWAMGAADLYMLSNKAEGIRSGAEIDLISNDELDDILKLCRWDQGLDKVDRKHLQSSGLLLWATNLPKQWEKNETPVAIREETVAHMEKIGLLSAILRPKDSADEFNAENLAAASGFIREWTKTEEGVQLLAAYPQHDRRVHIIGALSNIRLVGKEGRDLWAKRAFDQGAAEILLDHVSMGTIPSDIKASQHTLSVLASLRTAGMETLLPNRQFGILHSALLNPSRNWSDPDQVTLVRQAAAAGLDLNICEGRVLGALLEAAAKPENKWMSSLEPMLMALFEEGADPTLLPYIEQTPGRLAELAQAEQLRINMERNTATSPSTKSTTARRL